MTLPYPPPFQDLATLAEHLCVGESTIENWIRKGIFPPAKKIGGKRLWRWKDVEHHLAVTSELLPASADDEARKITEATREAARRSH